ncbi:MAG TPA: hypothetical protein VN231_01015 [Allosphingosinicella sp.]|nr:hypothetical protein [Allosphingosinicella sp.]
MALAALIAAYHESEEAGALRATLPLAGRTVVERQARLAAAAGAAPLIVLVERMPAALTAAIERLRRDRLPVKVARSAEEAAEAVDSNDRLLLIADGAIVEPEQLERLARSEGAAVLTVPDSGFGELYERIDAASRWAGAAVVDGSTFRETAAMLRDWDMQSTLLRRALQAGASHLAADGPVAILDRPADLAGLERQILASSAGSAGGWASRLLAPLERFVTLRLMAGPLGAPAVGLAAAFLAGLGAAALAYGWLRTGLALMLAATPLEGIAGRLARLRMRDDVGRGWWCYLLPLFAGAGLVALAYALTPFHGWGMILLAFTTLAFLAAAVIETEGGALPGGLFLADHKGMAWLMLPFAILGLWHVGLAFLFAYSAASFFWAQHQAHRPARPGQD